MPSGKCKLKQWDTTIHLLEWPKPNAEKGCGATEILIHFWCSANGTATLKESFSTSYKTTHTLTISSSNCALLIHPNELKTYPHKNLHMNKCYSSLLTTTTKKSTHGGLQLY